MLNINALTELNIVIGYPLNHTYTPALHNMIYQSLNLNAVLLAFSNPQLESLIKILQVLNIKLTAVTMPFKEKILDYIDTFSPEVEKLQSVNTVIQDSQYKLHGYNTDINGIRYALKNKNFKHQKILILGAGGAARAAGYYAQQQQAELYWHNRTLKKACSLANIFGGEVLNAHQFNHFDSNQFNLIINTTSLGMYPDIDHSAVSDHFFKPHHLVMDMVYNPYHTKFLQQALKNQAQIISGREMFIGQGIRQIELWTGKTFSETQVLRYLKKIF